jgi:hypothetical protein
VGDVEVGGGCCEGEGEKTGRKEGRREMSRARPGESGDEPKHYEALTMISAAEGCVRGVYTCWNHRL